jgi:hypothetical protein
MVTGYVSGCTIVGYTPVSAVHRRRRLSPATMALNPLTALICCILGIKSRRFAAIGTRRG